MNWPSLADMYLLGSGAARRSDAHRPEFIDRLARLREHQFVRPPCLIPLVQVIAQADPLAQAMA